MPPLAARQNDAPPDQWALKCWRDVAEILRAGACGAHTSRAVWAFMQVASFGLRRPLRLHGPRTRSLSADEQAMICLIEARQAGREAYLAAGASWLIRPGARPAFMIALREIADWLLLSGYELGAPPPAPTPPQGRAPEPLALAKAG